MTDRTKNCIKEINSIRENGVDLFFTVDAGPQVKVVCRSVDIDMVKERLQNKPYIMNLIEANIGYGARVTNEG